MANPRVKVELLPRTKVLEDNLVKIGFSLVHCGCNHFMIRNQFGNKAHFEIWDDRIRVSRKLFGARGRGSVSFNLSGYKIEHDGEHGMVSISAKDVENVYISFYGRKG